MTSDYHRLEAADADARKAAGFFGTFQTCAGIVAIFVLLLAVYTW